MQPFVSAGVFFSELSLLRKSTPVAEINKLCNCLLLFASTKHVSMENDLLLSTKHHQVQFRAVCHNETASISDHVILFIL